jgi:hypothetical protein
MDEIYCATACNLNQVTLTVKGSGTADCITSEYNLAVSLVVESGVTGIHANICWNWTSFVNISLPSSLTSIGDNAFRNCSKLESVEFGASAGIILGSWIFGDCTGLTNVSFLAGFGPSIGNYMFAWCPKLKNIDIPSSISSIGERAFDLTALVHLSLPWSLTNMGNRAFEQCYELLSVSFPNGSNVTAIPNEAFNDCFKLESFDFPSSLSIIRDWAFCDSGLVEISLPPSLSRICEGAFYNCPKLVSVSFGESLRSVEDRAFVKDASLTFMTFRSRPAVETFASNALSGLRSLEVRFLNISAVSETAFICPAMSYANLTSNTTFFVPEEFLDENPNAKICGISPLAVPGPTPLPTISATASDEPVVSSKLIECRRRRILRKRC